MQCEGQRAPAEIIAVPFCIGFIVFHGLFNHPDKRCELIECGIVFGQNQAVFNDLFSGGRVCRAGKPDEGFLDKGAVFGGFSGL